MVVWLKLDVYKRQADMLLKINDDGLSYIDDFQDVQVYKKINADLFALSYATYVLALADASIQDNLSLIHI